MSPTTQSNRDYLPRLVYLSGVAYLSGVEYSIIAVVFSM